MLTLVALAVGIVAARPRLFGRASRYVQAISYSATALVHMIPAITEHRRVCPSGRLVVPSQDAPVLPIANLALVILFLAVTTLQVRRLRTSLRATTAGPTVGPPVSITSVHG